MVQTAGMVVQPHRRRWLAVALSLAVPGLGHLYLRRYRRGVLWLLPVVVLGMLAVAVSRLSPPAIIAALLTPRTLWGIIMLNVAAALWRGAAALDVHRIAAEPVERGKPGRWLVAVGWLVVGVVVLVPHVVVGRYAVDALTLLDAVFVLDGEEVPAEAIIPIGTDADIVPAPLGPETAEDELLGNEPIPHMDTGYDRFRVNHHLLESVGGPNESGPVIGATGERGESPASSFPAFEEYVGEDRITVLLAGGDGGPGRGGMRTDTMMVATLDPETGKAAIFGFPRNLGHTPLPPRFGDAFVDLQRTVNERSKQPEQSSGNCKCFPEQLNALYPFTRKWTRTYPDEVDPGMAMLRDTLSNVMGIPIDYYMLVDMAAFVDLVDAIDGVDVYVQKPLAAEVSPPREGDPWAKVDVDVGWNHLDGSQALAYARARKHSSDYARMERQRCMVRAVAAKADPLTLLRKFPAIVDAVNGSVVTDFPLSLAPDLLMIVSRLDFDDIETVGFVHGYWQSERDGLGKPVLNVGRVRAKVKEVIAGEEDPSDETAVESECDA